MPTVQSHDNPTGDTLILTLANVLDLPADTHDRAAELYRSVTNHTSLRANHGPDTVAAACTLLAVREHGLGFEARDLDDHGPDTVSTHRVLRVGKAIQRELDLGPVQADPHHFVSTFADRLDASDAYADLVHDAIDAVVANGIATGKKPSTTAATCFYAVSMLPVRDASIQQFTQRDVANVANVSKLTIRENYREYGDIIADAVEPIAQPTWN